MAAAGTSSVVSGELAAVPHAVAGGAQPGEIRNCPPATAGSNRSDLAEAIGVQTHTPDRDGAVHDPVWPAGHCAGHPEPVAWPCPRAVEELYAAYGDGWQLAAHLWDLYEDVARTYQKAMSALEIRQLVIATPLAAVDAWARRPRTVEHWGPVAA